MNDDELNGQVHGVEAVEETDEFKAMLAGAGVIFVISFIPWVRMVCCLPYLLGALLAVHLFTRQYGVTLSTGRGIRLGILTCLLGGFAAWAVGTLIWLVFDVQLGAKEGEALGLWIAETAGGEEAVRQAREQMAQQRAAGVTLGQMLIGVVAVGITGAITGLIGGALGARMFRRGPKQKGA
jgi:hypothetical protein